MARPGPRRVRPGPAAPVAPAAGLERRRRRGQGWIATAGPVLLILAAAPFALYAGAFGWSGLSRDLSGETYLWRGPVSNAAIFGHMLAGALITLLVPLQLVAPLRARLPRLHRALGHAIAAAAAATALGGLAFIALGRTVGGPLMDAGFALYGALVLLCAVQTVRHARAGRSVAHRAWALRLFVLVMASWLYRVHYGLWYAATGGLWSNEAFTGAFDRVQTFAFFLPYLALVELWLARRPRAGHRPAGA